MEKFGKIIDVNGNEVGKVTGFWTSQRVVFIEYNDGTDGYVGDERFTQNNYQWLQE